MSNSQKGLTDFGSTESQTEASDTSSNTMSTTQSVTDSTRVSNEEVIDALIQIALDIDEQLESGGTPSLKVPTRTKSNIKYNEELGVYDLGDKMSTRSAKSVRGARKLEKILYVIDFLIDQLEQGKSSTLRELYYLSESWDHEEAQFNDQDDSNNIVEEVEIISGVLREYLNMRPEEDGATIIGPLSLTEQTRTGTRDIHCQDTVGEGGYTVPTNIDSIELNDHDANFVLAVETGGMRDRLVENGFDTEYGAIIVHLKGQPARATRRIIKRIHNEMDLPVAVFCDCDPWSYRIHGSVAYGSINSAHISEYLATPEAEYLGIRPEDIKEYDLPTDPLSDSDINALESELTDPRFESNEWEEQIKLQLDLGKKAEQQSLAKHGLEFVTETYLPERLEELGFI